MKYTEVMRTADLRAIANLAHEVGGYSMEFKLINGWGDDKGKLPSIVFGRCDNVTLAQKVDAILEHLGIEVLPGPTIVIKEKATK